MKNKNIIFLAIASMFLMTSCNEWLDVMPDNRAEIDSEEKVIKLLASAYPTNTFAVVAEYMSDNTDDYGEDNPYTDRFSEQLFYWQDITENDDDGPKGIWEGHYGAITNDNQALAAIEEMGGATTTSLKAAKGEALLCRAYNHFILANIFCNAYNPATAANELGIPYMEKAETELNPKYERGTLAEVYALIDKDLQEGLPLINDAIYSVPKYHFNQKAAYTFASRFYLFYGKWDKVVEYASLALGSNPKEYMRDYEALTALPRKYDVRSEAFNNSSQKTNFLINAVNSQVGVRYLPFNVYDRFGHGTFILNTEILNYAPWGSYTPQPGGYMCQYVIKLAPMMYIGTNFDTGYFQHTPYMFEYTDPVAGIGYPHSNMVLLTAEEALLNRAEAYVMLKDYDSALADINLWTNNTLDPVMSVKAGVPVTPELTKEIIETWNTDTPYYSPKTPTSKKQLNPQVAAVEAGTQEAFIQTLLIMRRIEFMEYGYRWFDVKRYGLEIYRRIVAPSGSAADVVVKDHLKLDDKRRAVQIPQDVVTAGLTPNPR